MLFRYRRVSRYTLSNGPCYSPSNSPCCTSVSLMIAARGGRLHGGVFQVNATLCRASRFGLAYNHPWMLTTPGCPFLALALCCGLYYLLGPVGPRIAPIIFVRMALFYFFSKRQHSEHLTCLASLRSHIFSERMPPLGTFCFLCVSLHLSLPTQSWLGLIQGEGDGDQGQERMLLLWKSF